MRLCGHASTSWAVIHFASDHALRRRCARLRQDSPRALYPFLVCSPTFSSAFTAGAKAAGKSMPSRFAPDSTETGQSEGDGVDSGPEVDDRVLALG